jgi:hypothetical protein
MNQLTAPLNKGAFGRSAGAYRVINLRASQIFDSRGCNHLRFQCKLKNVKVGVSGFSAARDQGKMTGELDV